RFRIVFEDFADVRDEPRQCVVGDSDALPHDRKDFVLLDHTRRTLEQQPKEVDPFGLNRERLAIFPELERTGIELVRAKSIPRICVHRLFQRSTMSTWRGPSKVTRSNIASGSNPSPSDPSFASRLTKTAGTSVRLVCPTTNRLT